MPPTVNVHEAKTTLSKLLERVERGESIVIARAGKPVAELVPHRRVDLVLGTAAGEIAYDSASFDDVDPEVLALFASDEQPRRGTA